MGNQAQQNQELELWQVVSSNGNKNVWTRPAGQIRTDMLSRPDMQRRGNISSYNRSDRNLRSTGAVRTSNPRPVEAVRNRNSRPVDPVKAGNSRTAETVTRRTSRPTQQIQTMRPSSQRTSTRRVETGTRRQSTGARTQARKKRKAGKRARVTQFFAIMWIVAMSAVIIFMGKSFYKGMYKNTNVEQDIVVKPVFDEIPVMAAVEKKPVIREDFLTISEYNRPGTKLAAVKNIFVHYTANKGTSAAQNRSYFENLGITHERAASAHFIIGYEGEIVQCIPLEEEAYAVVERNGDSISIECCYIADDGSFTKETYNSLVEMLAWLIDKYDLEPMDILRHYDCGGKKCPIYYVEHEDAWERLLDDVENYTF